jgi:hypothetical protein
MSTSTVSPPFIEVAALQGWLADAPKLILPGDRRAVDR